MFLMFLSSFEHKFTVLYVIAYECTHPFGTKDEYVYLSNLPLMILKPSE